MVRGRSGCGSGARLLFCATNNGATQAAKAAGRILRREERRRTCQLSLSKRPSGGYGASHQPRLDGCCQRRSGPYRCRGTGTDVPPVRYRLAVGGDRDDSTRSVGLQCESVVAVSTLWRKKRHTTGCLSTRKATRGKARPSPQSTPSAQKPLAHDLAVFNTPFGLPHMCGKPSAPARS
jgi:hypothetical protein